MQLGDVFREEFPAVSQPYFESSVVFRIIGRYQQQNDTVFQLLEDL